MNAYGLPDTCHLPMSDLMDAISLDKKNLNNHLNLVLLHQIGDSYVYPADLTSLTRQTKFKTGGTHL